MSGEEACFQERERTTYKRRSSILKRQDTCIISEDGGEEGPRTPRRVSFAQSTMIKEFYSIPWPSHDDSSLHSSRSSQSSSSTDEGHDSIQPEACPQASLPGHSGSAAVSMQTSSVQDIVFEDQSVNCKETSIMRQNRTIMFRELDGSQGEMDLTTNLMDRSRSVCEGGDAGDGDPATNQPWLYQTTESSGQDRVKYVPTSPSQPQTDHQPMEMTENVNISCEKNNHQENFGHLNDRFSSKRNEGNPDNTDDMELTADLMYSSRTALVDISSFNPHGCATNYEKKTVVKASNNISFEDQENNPLLILQSSQPRPEAHKSCFSPDLELNTSNMEFTMNLADPSGMNHSHAMSPFKVAFTATNSDGSSKAACERSLDHVENVVSVGNKRARFPDQFTGHVLSPVGEVSGLNNSSWAGAQDSLAVKITPVNSSSQRITEKLQQDESVFYMKSAGVTHESQLHSKTIYFSSFTVESTGPDTGNVELTENIKSNITMYPSSSANDLKQHNITSLQDSMNHFSQHDKENIVSSIESQTKTVYFNLEGGPGANISDRNAGGDMELTEACSSNQINMSPSYPMNLIQGLPRQEISHNESLHDLEKNHNSSSQSSEKSQESLQSKPKTIYFDGEEGADEMDISLVTTSSSAANVCKNLDDDPEIRLNFSGCLPSSREYTPLAHKEILEKPDSSSASTNISQTEINVDRNRPEQGLVCPKNDERDEVLPKICKEKPNQSFNASLPINVSNHQKLETSCEYGPKKSHIEPNAVASVPLENPTQPNEVSRLKVFTPSEDEFYGASAQNCIGMKKKDAAKNSLMKDMKHFLMLSKRTPSTFHSRKSTGSLYLRTQGVDDKSEQNLSMAAFSSRKSTTHTECVTSQADDEVDAMKSSAGCDNTSSILNPGPSNPFNSSALNTPALSKSNPSNAALSAIKSPTIASAVNERSLLEVAYSPNRSTSAVVSTANERNVSPVASVNRISSSALNRSHTSSVFTSSQDRSIAFGINPSPHVPTKNESSNLRYSASPDKDPCLIETASETPQGRLLGEKQPSNVDVEEEDMLELTEGLNYHSFALAENEEAREDFLQNLDSLVAEAACSAPKSQEEVFTLEEMYRIVGFEHNITQERAAHEMHINTNTLQEKLHAKLAIVPKIETLQHFVKDMEHAVNKIKQDNSDKLQNGKNILTKSGTMHLLNKEEVKASALEMCQACRMSSRTKWRQHEGDHLIKYSTLRETAFENLNLDVEVLEKDTGRCDELLGDIDICLQEINSIQQVKKDIALQEARLAEMKVESSHSVKKAVDVEHSVRSVQEKNKDLSQHCASSAAAQDKIHEQLSWLGSFREWTLLRKLGQEIHFGFLFNTLVLQVCISNSCTEGKTISGIFLKSRLAGASKPWAKLSHQLAVSSIDCDGLKSRYRTLDQLSKLLLHVSTVMCNCRQLSTEIKWAHLKHRVSIDELKLKIYILDRKQRRKIRLETLFDSHYPDEKLAWTVTTLLGNVNSEAITQATSQVPPGHHFLQRSIAAAETALSRCAR